jgi:hypothetical protein
MEIDDSGDPKFLMAPFRELTLSRRLVADGGRLSGAPRDLNSICSRFGSAKSVKIRGKQTCGSFRSNVGSCEGF